MPHVVRLAVTPPQQQPVLRGTPVYHCARMFPPVVFSDYTFHATALSAALERVLRAPVALR